MNFHIIKLNYINFSKSYSFDLFRSPFLYIPLHEEKSHKKFHEKDFEKETEIFERQDYIDWKYFIYCYKDNRGISLYLIIIMYLMQCKDHFSSYSYCSY